MLVAVLLIVALIQTVMDSMVTTGLSVSPIFRYVTDQSGNGTTVGLHLYAGPIRAATAY